MTGRTLVEKQTIERQLRQAAKVGYAAESGENEDGAFCIGAPIFNTDRYPIAAVSLSAPAAHAARTGRNRRAAAGGSGAGGGQ